MLHFVECAPALPAGISPLMLSDQLLTLAQQADRAGFAGTAEQLVGLACAVLDAPPRPADAADAIDAGNGAQASGPLTASRRYLLRSYSGAKYLIAHPPPAPAEADSANPLKFRKLARSFVRASHHGQQRGWLKAHASGGAPAGPAFADGPTAAAALSKM